MPNKLYDAVLLYSGGLDSLIAWEYLGRPQRLYVSMGHKYVSAERQALVRSWGNPVLQGKGDDAIQIEWAFDLADWELPDAKIPARNMILGIAGARRAQSKVWLVAQRGEMCVPDKTRGFFVEASRMLSRLFERPIAFDTPFADMDKTEMVAWWLSKGLDAGRLVESWSCYHPVQEGQSKFVECGNCPACMRKFIALELNGICQVGHYATANPRRSDAALTYVRRAREGDFDARRTRRTLKALVGE